MIKSYLYILFLLLLGACGQYKPEYPVYKVDLDHPDTLRTKDLFSKIEVIPLQTTEKSRFIHGELGINKGRYYILDRNQQLFFCFDSTGKFKYVVDNKPKEGKEKQLQYRSILNPYRYYYKKQWYSYLTFRNVVYTNDKEGNRHIQYMWDFGKYNDDKETEVSFPALPLQIVSSIQQAWLKTYCAFALTKACQTDDYIYTFLERITGDSLMPADQRFYHLFCYKPTRKCYYFNKFSDGISLSNDLRLQGNCMLTLLPYYEKEKFLNLDLLDEKSRNMMIDFKEGDNPVVLKWYLKN